MNEQRFILGAISTIRVVIPLVLKYVKKVICPTKSGNVKPSQKYVVLDPCGNNLRDFDIGDDTDDTVFEEFENLHNSTSHSDNENRKDETNWKQHRGNVGEWFLLCLRYSIKIVLIGLLLGLISTIIMAISIVTEGACPYKYMQMDSLQVHHWKLGVESTIAWFIQFLPLTSTCITFGPRLVADLQLIIWNLSGAFLDTVFRLYLEIFNEYHDWRRFILMTLFFSLTVFNSYRIAKHFHQKKKERKQRFILCLKLCVQYILGVPVCMSVFYGVVWEGYRGYKNFQIYIAASLSAFLVVLKFVTRVTTESIVNVIHPGRLIGSLLHMYVTITIVLRIFHAEFNTTLYTVFCIVHGFQGVVERLFLNFKDNIFACFSKKILKRDGCKIFQSSRRTPRLQRFLADLTICSIFMEINALVYANAFVATYASIFPTETGSIDKAVLRFFLRVFIGIVIELGLSICTIFSLTWYENIPLIKVWSKRWKFLLISNLLTCSLMVLFLTNNLVAVVVAKYQHTTQLNDTQIAKKCSEIELWHYIF